MLTARPYSMGRKADTTTVLLLSSVTRLQIVPRTSIMRRMGIPEKLEGIREDDIDMLAKRAAREANPLYPVPKIMRRDQLKEIYYRIRA